VVSRGGVLSSGGASTRYSGLIKEHPHVRTKKEGNDLLFPAGGLRKSGKYVGAEVESAKRRNVGGNYLGGGTMRFRGENTKLNLPLEMRRETSSKRESIEFLEKNGTQGEGARQSK